MNRIKFTHHFSPAASVTGHSEALAWVLEDSKSVLTELLPGDLRNTSAFSTVPFR
uniref:Uncharacterized protein n=1 Tax=Sus scrofa TaxID=9823 RepID=A0A4X1U470_PIG